MKDARSLLRLHDGHIFPLSARAAAAVDRYDSEALQVEARFASVLSRRGRVQGSFSATRRGLRTSKATFNKYHVTRELLTGLNEKGERVLESEEILKRVTEFDDFSVLG